MSSTEIGMDNAPDKFRGVGSAVRLRGNQTRAQGLAALAFRESPAPQLITRDRVIADCNKQFLALFGYTADDLVGELVLKLYPSTADYYMIGERCRKWVATHTFYEDERFMQHENGEIFWARARGVTLTPDRPFDLMIWNFERIHHRATKTASLTRREREISGHIVNGLTCKESALKLGISHRTVEVHRGRLMKKLDAKNTADLVSKIIMVKPDDGL
jgi:PAS domain S-box-containing protein